jgi:hypothetical protein
MAGPTLQREASVRAVCNGPFTSHGTPVSIGPTMARARDGPRAAPIVRGLDGETEIFAVRDDTHRHVALGIGLDRSPGMANASAWTSGSSPPEMAEDDFATCSSGAKFGLFSWPRARARPPPSAPRRPHARVRPRAAHGPGGGGCAGRAPGRACIPAVPGWPWAPAPVCSAR